MTTVEEFNETLAHPEPAPTPFKAPGPVLNWKRKNPDDPFTGDFTTNLPTSLEDEKDIFEALYDEIEEDWGLSREKVMIRSGSLAIIGWDGGTTEYDVEGRKITGKQRLRRYKVTLVERPRGGKDYYAEDIEAMMKYAEKLPRVKVKDRPDMSTVDLAMLVLLADWQLGKGERDGSLGSFIRICKAQELLIQRIQDLKKIGQMPQAIYLIGLGDMVEGCAGFYDMQAFQTDINQKDQLRMATKLIIRMVDLIIKHFPELPITVAGVPGNHGENRNEYGKAFTDWGDNFDLAAVQMAGLVFDANPERYAMVEWFTPKDELDMRIDIAGVRCGFVHGHQFGNGQASVAGKSSKWWSDQALGTHTVAQCELLFSGHFHHFLVTEETGRTFMQAPAMDPGSYWIESKKGVTSPAGMLTMMLSRAYDDQTSAAASEEDQRAPRLWNHLAIL